MNKQPPIVQALASALLAAVMLSAVHVFARTRPGDPHVYAFIAVVAVSSFILTFIRSTAILEPERYKGHGRFLQSRWFLVLTFLALMIYGVAFSILFTLEPGESRIHGLGLALAPSAVITILLFRRSRRLANAFWPTFAMVITIAIASAGVAWALERYV